MLPGFRFLFAAIMLSMSVLIFGLGAAALLRAAHEEFVSLPTRRAPPEPIFARLDDDPPPTLALLRVDPRSRRSRENVRCRRSGSGAGHLGARPGQTPETAPAEPEKLAALKPAERTQVEAGQAGRTCKETSAETPAAQAARSPRPLRSIPK